MNIKDAKNEIIHTLAAYLKKDGNGVYTYPLVRQRPILLIGPPALKNLLIAYVGGLFGRFVVMAVIYFVLAIVLGVLVSRHKKHRA